MGTGLKGEFRRFSSARSTKLSSSSSPTGTLSWGILGIISSALFIFCSRSASSWSSSLILLPIPRTSSWSWVASCFAAFSLPPLGIGYCGGFSAVHFLRLKNASAHPRLTPDQDQNHNGDLPRLFNLILITADKFQVQQVLHPFKTF